MDQLAYEEIDLRVYVRTLFRNWLWIGLSAVVCGVAALVVSLMLPPSYETAALVAITDERYSVRLDERFETTDELPSYKVYTDLATSDDVLLALWDGLTERPEAMESWHALGKVVEAESGSDDSLLRLTVKLKSGTLAADVANAWAEVLVDRVNEIYGSSGEDLAFVSEQLAVTKVELDAAESAVVAFQGTNPISILQNKVSIRLGTQDQYLKQLRSIDNLTRDIRDLRSQMQAQPAGYRVTFGDRLTALSLQVRSFNAQTSMPIELQITSRDTLSDATLAEQIQLLDELLVTLGERVTDIEGEIAALEPQILVLQRELEGEETELSRLTIARDLARDTYTLLTRKLTESQIAAADEQGRVVLASYAAVPDDPASPSKMLNTAIGLAVGVMMSTMVVFVLEWWRQGETSA